MQKERLIEYWESELEFTNSIIEELKKQLREYGQMANGEEALTLSELLMSNSDTNDSLITSYHINLEKYLFQKEGIERMLINLKTNL